MPKTKTSQSADFRAHRDSVYANVVREMRNRTSKQIFATLVDAGIYTRNGRLTKHYRPA